MIEVVTCYTADRTSAPTLRPQPWEPWSASHTPCASGGSPSRSPAPPGTLPPDTEEPSPSSTPHPSRRLRRRNTLLSLSYPPTPTPRQN